MRILTVAILSLIPFSLFASARSNSGGLASRVAQLEAQSVTMAMQIETLTSALEEAQEILQFVHVETGEIYGLTGPHWIIEGANVHVRSGFGSTVEDCAPGVPGYPNCESLTGLGNLIVGYNERMYRLGSGPPRQVRTGSHNLVVGQLQTYTSFAGFVAGESNKVTGSHASVSGGTDSEASGDFSSVSGGHRQLASGFAASVSGGQDREAPDDLSWAAGNLFETN